MYAGADFSTFNEFKKGEKQDPRDVKFLTGARNDIVSARDILQVCVCVRSSTSNRKRDSGSKVCSGESGIVLAVVLAMYCLLDFVLGIRRRKRRRRREEGGGGGEPSFKNIGSPPPPPPPREPLFLQTKTVHQRFALSKLSDRRIVRVVGKEWRGTPPHPG